MGVYPKWRVDKGKSLKKIWMMTRGSPILGNLQYGKTNRKISMRKSRNIHYKMLKTHHECRSFLIWGPRGLSTSLLVVPPGYIMIICTGICDVHIILGMLHQRPNFAGICDGDFRRKIWNKTMVWVNVEGWNGIFQWGCNGIVWRLMIFMRTCWWVDSYSMGFFDGMLWRFHRILIGIWYIWKLMVIQSDSITNEMWMYLANQIL